MPRRGVLAVSGLLAVALAAALILVSRLWTAEPSMPGQLNGPSEAVRQLAGVGQRGIALGSPNAPVTLVEYADLQCPHCAEWAIRTLPTLDSDYVRPGRVRIEFRGLAFIGPDSDKALRAALAPANQDRLWHVVELLYRNQGAENSGWVSDELLREIAASIPGLDVERMLEDADSASVTAAIARAAAQAEAAGVRGTPTLFVGRTGGRLTQLALSSLDPGGTVPALQQLLGR